MVAAYETSGAIEKLRETGVAALMFARRVTMGLLEDISDDRFFHQPFHGANHAAWIVGHICRNDDNFLTGLEGRPSQLPASWEALFAAGSSPAVDTDHHPNRDQILTQFEARRHELLAWFREMPTERLISPVPEDWKTFGATYGILMSTLAWHEGLHAGQLTVIRKSLGIAPKFG